MKHNCEAMGLHPANCPLHEGSIIDDPSTRDRVVNVELSYPPREYERDRRPYSRVIEVGLMDVRAADDLRISYDFKRDGWSIQQAWIEVVVVAPSSEHPHGYDDHVDRWEEVAFIRAWGLNAEKGMAGPGSKVGE
jgi:hypothetical protein